MDQQNWYGIWDDSPEVQDWVNENADGKILWGPNPVIQAVYRRLISDFDQLSKAHNQPFSPEAFRRRFKIRRFDQMGEPVGEEIEKP